MADSLSYSPEIQAALGDVPQDTPDQGLSYSPEIQAAMGGSILPSPTTETQPFGNVNPGVEVMSGGVNNGSDFGTPVGTPVSLPPGEWHVVDAYSADSQPGYVGDSTNSGYGNSVLVKNAKTGESLRFSHLSSVHVKPGQAVPGGELIGATGATGNVTGPHLDLEYKDPQGNYQDVLSSPYAKYIQTR